MHIDIVNGFLGSGKTTFILKLLDQIKDLDKVALLINEFGDVGIDGSLISDKTEDKGKIVELSSGCICCSLNKDLKNQIKDLASNYKPSRLVIEPTGVATINNLIDIVTNISLEDYISTYRIISIINALHFKDDFFKNQKFLSEQIKKSQVLILNKCDLVKKKEVKEIQMMISHLNPQVEVIATTYGEIDFKKMLFNDFATITLNDEVKKSIEHDHEHNHEHENFFSSYQSVSITSDKLFTKKRVRDLLARVNKGEFGQIMRAKGIFKVNDGESLLAEYSYPSQKTIERTEVNTETNRFILIGEEIDKKGIEEIM